jgi:hypothetical protein
MILAYQNSVDHLINHRTLQNTLKYGSIKGVNIDKYLQIWYNINTGTQHLLLTS